MAKYYELTDPQNRLYFAQEAEDGSMLVLDATELSDAVVEAISMCDFEGNVELCAVQEGVTIDDAYDIVYERLRETIVFYTPQEVLELVLEGASHPIHAGWVQEVEGKTANSVEVKPTTVSKAKATGKVKVAKTAAKPAAKAAKPVAKAAKAAVTATAKNTAKPASKAASTTPKTTAKAGKAATEATPKAKPGKATPTTPKTTAKAGKAATEATPKAKPGKAMGKPAAKKK